MVIMLITILLIIIMAGVIYLQMELKDGVKDAQMHPMESKAAEVFTIAPVRDKPKWYDVYAVDMSHTFEGVMFDKLPEERAKDYAQWLFNEGFSQVNVTIPEHEAMDVNVVWDL